MFKPFTDNIQEIDTNCYAIVHNGKVLYHLLVEKRPGLRVIYMSGYTADVISHHGVLDSGINFIQKPFSLRELTTKVRSVLDL